MGEEAISMSSEKSACASVSIMDYKIVYDMSWEQEEGYWSHRNLCFAIPKKLTQQLHKEENTTQLYAIPDTEPAAYKLKMKNCLLNRLNGKKGDKKLCFILILSICGLSKVFFCIEISLKLHFMSKVFHLLGTIEKFKLHLRYSDTYRSNC